MPMTPMTAQEREAAERVYPPGEVDAVFERVFLKGGDDAVRAKIAECAKMPTTAGLPGTDPGMSRLAEDLLDILITKGTVAFSDVPAPTRTKINRRRKMRGQQPYP